MGEKAPVTPIKPEKVEDIDKNKLYDLIKQLEKIPRLDFIHSEGGKTWHVYRMEPQKLQEPGIGDLEQAFIIRDQVSGTKQALVWDRVSGSQKSYDGVSLRTITFEGEVTVNFDARIPKGRDLVAKGNPKEFEPVLKRLQTITEEEQVKQKAKESRRETQVD